MLAIVSCDSSVPKVRSRWAWMSRIVIPPEYRLMIMSDSPPTRRWPFGTSRGSKLPLRSRGVASSMSPTSVPSRFPVDPFRELPDPFPAGSCFS